MHERFWRRKSRRELLSSELLEPTSGSSVAFAVVSCFVTTLCSFIPVIKKPGIQIDAATPGILTH